MPEGRPIGVIRGICAIASVGVEKILHIEAEPSGGTWLSKPDRSATAPQF